MFLRLQRGGYNRHDEQVAHGLFLIIVQKPDDKAGRPELRACARHIRMKQLGHWMMANVNLGGFNICLSGTYGSDGLPLYLGQHFPNGKPAQFTDEQALALFNKLLPIPAELQTAFWDGGGHNTGGKEMPLFKDWGLKNEKELRKPIPKTPA